MIKNYWVFAFCLLNSVFSTAQVGNLIWSDEFNGAVLDQTKWSYETGTGVNGDWGTGQLDVATSRIENVRFEKGIPNADDGCLVITTRKEIYQGRNFTSGRIRTMDKAFWGPGHRIVARVFPKDVRYKGQGFAFWMMPQEIPQGWNYIMWPQGGEIDIMEYVGSIPYNNLGTVHYAWFWKDNEYVDWNHGHLGAYYNYQTQQVPIPEEPDYGNYPPEKNDLNAGSHGFHEYGIDWFQDRMEFFVDDHVYHIHYFEDGGAYRKDGEDKIAIQTIGQKRVGVSEYSNHFEEWHPFENRMYAILSAGVGGQNYTYGGSIVPEAEFPCSVYIDWVRVYELEDSALSVNPIKAEEKIRIFPNPGLNEVNIEVDDFSDFNISIFTVAGSKVMEQKLNSSKSIDISALKKGVYLLNIKSSNLSVSKKIIKN